MRNKRIYYILLIFTFAFLLRQIDITVEARNPVNPIILIPNEKPASVCDGEINSLFCNPDYKWDPKTMIAICRGEDWFDKWDNKGWKPELTHQNLDGTHDTGICQINSIHGFDDEKLKNPKYNIEAAYSVWEGSHYKAWAEFNNGDYLRHLKGLPL